MLAEALNFLTQTQPAAGYALMAIGAVKGVEHVSSIAGGIWKHFLRPRRWLKSRYTRPNVESWVVISGLSFFNNIRMRHNY